MSKKMEIPANNTAFLLVWYISIELWIPAKWWWGVGGTEAETGKDGLGHATKVLYTTPARCHFIETSW